MGEEKGLTKYTVTVDLPGPDWLRVEEVGEVEDCPKVLDSKVFGPGS